MNTVLAFDPWAQYKHALKSVVTTAIGSESVILSQVVPFEPGQYISGSTIAKGTTVMNSQADDSKSGTIHGTDIVAGATSLTMSSGIELKTNMLVTGLGIAPGTSVQCAGASPCTGTNVPLSHPTFDKVPANSAITFSAVELHLSKVPPHRYQRDRV